MNRWLKSTALFMCMLLFCCRLQAQEKRERRKFKDVVKFSGYIKGLGVGNIVNLDTTYGYGFLHNRLNLKLYFTNTFTAGIEVRNRLFFGQLVQLNPLFGKSIDVDNGLVKMQYLLLNRRAVVLHTAVDRFWFDWSYKQWQVRVGRQRINWGKSLLWNPNDLFNAANFADFDYEERPGSDAVKLAFFPTGMSSIEVAVKPGKKKNETVAAAMVRFNKWNYDFQLVGGLYYTDIALGFGWAGNIKNAGFRGEATWFAPKDGQVSYAGIFSGTVEADYAFKNTLYLHGAILYSNHPSRISNPLVIGQSFSGTLTAKNLMPCNWSFYGELSGNITPLFHAGLSSIYGLQPDLLFIMPNLTYSISDNWDLMLVAQSVLLFNKGQKPIKSNTLFARLKYSF